MELDEWIDQQTKDDKPAVLLIYDDADDLGHVYLANGPAFGMPVIAALDVPRHHSTQIGGHLDFLCEEHRAGKPVLADQTSAQKTEKGYAYYRLVKPNDRRRRKLMQRELSQSRFRWPKADVLILEPAYLLH